MSRFVEFVSPASYCDPDEYDRAERMGLPDPTRETLIPLVLDLDRIEAFYAAKVLHAGRVINATIVATKGGENFQVTTPFEDFRNMVVG